MSIFQRCFCAYFPRRPISIAFPLGEGGSRVAPAVYNCPQLSRLTDEVVKASPLAGSGPSTKGVSERVLAHILKCFWGSGSFSIRFPGVLFNSLGQVLSTLPQGSDYIFFFLRTVRTTRAAAAASTSTDPPMIAAIAPPESPSLGSSTIPVAGITSFSTSPQEQVR